MTAVQLKTRIKERLEKTDDPKLLEAIYEMLKSADDEVVKFTPEQRARVMRGLEQMKNGEVSTHEETMEELREWLKKK
ncbi:MAG: hypothetical protein H6601_01375 [Flavobacteriales bacterium]|nr:hypothetical protein [Flavobacteriales bacterium]